MEGVYFRARQEGAPFVSRVQEAKALTKFCWYGGLFFNFPVKDTAKH